MAADDYSIISKHGKTTTASAVSPNSVKRPKERVPAKPDMPEVNTFIICQLCSGYLIDATAVVECQHTFCKSCILKYLETSSYCPVCDVQLNKGLPHFSLRSDVILQRLVYKLVPGLLVSEIRRRRDFFIKKGIDYLEAGEQASNSITEEIKTATDTPTVLTVDDVVSLSIEYYRSGTDSKETTSDISSTPKSLDTNGKQAHQSAIPSGSPSTQQSSQNQQQKANVKSLASAKSTESSVNVTDATSITDTSNSNSNEQANDRRYLQCPAAVSVGLLKKFIRMKYGLSDDYRVDLLYNGDSENILENDLTLVDVAFIFDWKNKDDPMNVHYRIFEKPVKSMTVFSGMKRPAPSVMDEPPDDDTASGPHNRSSMFSSSSAPSSKLPRLADNTSASGNQGNVRNSNTSGKTTTASLLTSSLPATDTDPSPASKISTNTLSKSSSNPPKSVSQEPSQGEKVSTVPSLGKEEKEEVDDDEDDEDEDDEEEDYELVERKEHMKGIKSSRRLRNSIKESMKRSVAVASSNVSLKVHHVSPSHSTDINGSESSRNENSPSSGKRSSNGKKRGKSHERSESKGKSGKVEAIRLRVSSTSSLSSEANTNDGSDSHHQQSHHHQPLKLSISTSGATPAVVSSSCLGKKEPLKLSLGSVLAKTGSKSPERKHHKHKHHHHHHKLRHRDKPSKGVTPSATVTNSQKPLKISFTLSPPSGLSAAPNQSQKPKLVNQEAVGTVEVKDQQQGVQGKGKPPANVQNYNNSARTSASAHGHLNNISKSISVSVNTNANSNNPVSSSANTTSPTNNKGSHQFGNKTLSPAELIPKNTGIEIQPTTIPISTSQISQPQNSVMQSSSSTAAHNNSHKHSHPLLPDSVQVPKSVTLIPVNPNQITGNNSSSGNTGARGSNTGNTSMNSLSGATLSSQEKASYGTQQHNNQNRINSHTFTHPITNKSLHQITVTEVPPPQQKPSGANNVVVTTTSTTHSSISVSTTNPIEKVIANAANNKPQFNGPGSMEITKIYCGTTNKDNHAKKLKDRKGLDISITGTGINVNVNKPSHNKLEEALRQKVNIAIGGGSGSISVTPAPPPNNMSILGATLTANNANNAMNNKMKSVSTTAANLLSGKMPPGITIGPATAPPSSSSSTQNASGKVNNSSTNNQGGNNSMNNANANNLVKSLGVTLPPHLTAHPHNPNSMKISQSLTKSDNMNTGMSTSSLNTNNSRLLGKDNVSIIGKSNLSLGTGGQQQPPPVEITISASGSTGNKGQMSINRSGISIVNKSKISNDPLASILDITQGLQRKSPNLPVNTGSPAATKDTKAMSTLNSTVNQPQQQGNKNVNVSNKRPFELVSIGGVPPTGNTMQGNENKKVAKEQNDMKRSRSASSSSETDKSKQQQKGNKTQTTGEIPLDLSGRAARVTPPLNIPNPRDSSKSPSDKTKKSPESSEKPGFHMMTSFNQHHLNAAGALVSKNSSTVNSHPGLPKPNVVSHQNQKPSAPPAPAPQPKAISVSKLSPNQSSKIGSIVDSLAQKQAQAQIQQQQQHQQQLHNMKSSQNQQSVQHQSSQQKQQQQKQTQQLSTPSHISSAKPHPSPSSSGSMHTGSSTSGNATKSMSTNSSSKGSPSSSRLTSPITASSGIPMTSPSPPGSGGVSGEHLRNLWTLSDPANRQGKLNQMNELLVAASLFSPPGHQHTLAGATAAHHLVAAAAAMAASGSPTGTGGSPGTNTGFNSNVFATQFGHHLAALGAANKIPPGVFEQHIMAAALNAHNAQAAAAGMRMHHPHPFAGSMSPPLNLPNAFFPPHGAPSAAQQQQQQSLATSPKVASVNSKQASSPGGNSTGASGKSNNQMGYNPLFSHSVPVPTQKSPSVAPIPPASMKSPTTGQVLPFTTTSSGTTNNTTVNTHANHMNITIQHDSKQTSSTHHSHNSLSGKPSRQHHHDSPQTHSNTTSSNSSSNKSGKINGTLSTAMPVFPPGIHNPLLPSRNSSNSNNFQPSNTSTPANKNLSSLNRALTSPAANSSKGAIPNSMKISNFLPNKPKDSTSNANDEATITSGSHFGIPPMQAKPNFSLSPTRQPNNLIPPSLNLPLNPIPTFPHKESSSPVTSPISPVKGLLAAGGNKPSTMTCASLLLPDFSPAPHPQAHHLLSTLSPPKGDHNNTQHHHGASSSSRLSNRTPSSDSVLLSPSGSLSSSKMISPGSSTNKSHTPTNKDGSRPCDISQQTRNKSLSPTKEISKKEIGSSTAGPVLGIPGLNNKNFSAPVSSSVSLSSLARPIPTIPAFLNRSANNTPTNPALMSSTMNIHNLPLHAGKEGLLQKATSPAKSSSSLPGAPVSMSNEQHSHLPSPVFPYPGVSVPVQVKLQDEQDVALAAVTPQLPPTLSSPSLSHCVSLKSEVNKLLAAKEEKVDEKRKRSCSFDQTFPQQQLSNSVKSDNSSEQIFDGKEKTRSEVPPPAKLQKIEMQANMISAVKSENVAPVSENRSESTEKCISSEGVVAAGAKSESLLEAQRESKIKEGERIEKMDRRKEGDDAVVVAGADPQTQSTRSPVQESCLSTAETKTLHKNTVTSSPITVTEISSENVEASLVDGKTDAHKSSNADDAVSDSTVQAEVAKTHISVDKISQPSTAELFVSGKTSPIEASSFVESLRKSDECQDVNIPKNDTNRSDIAAETDVEMKSEKITEEGKCEILENQSSMEHSSGTVMAIELDAKENVDLEVAERKIREERVTILKATEDEDIDVDVVDDDEPMEVNTVQIHTVDNADINMIKGESPAAAAIEQEAMEVVNDDENGSEIIESQPETNTSLLSFGARTEDVNNLKDDDKDMIRKSTENIVEEEAERETHKDPVEISVDVIETEKVEETESLSQVQEEEDISLAADKIEVESTFVTVNESSNFSQDDSECGDLIIDLGPGENEEDDDGNEHDAENDEINEKATEELETQGDSNEAVVVLEIKECGDVSSPSATQTKEDLLINAGLSIIAGDIDADEGETNHVVKSPAGEGEQVDNSKSSEAVEMLAKIESCEREQQVAPAEPLNQNSIPNQITINPDSIEVNGVIKMNMELENREESETSNDVAVCPEIMLQDNVVASSPAPQSMHSQEERGAEEDESEHSGNIDTLEENNKTGSESEPNTDAKVESNTQLDWASPVVDNTVKDNETDNDMGSSSEAVVTKNEEEQEESMQGELVIETEPELPTSIPNEEGQNTETQPDDVSAHFAENVTEANYELSTPVVFPEQEVSEKEEEKADLKTDDNQASHETIDSSLCAAETDIDMETSMEVDQDTPNEPENATEEMVIDVAMEEPSEPVTVPEIDEVSMQMEIYNEPIVPPEQTAVCEDSSEVKTAHVVDVEDPSLPVNINQVDDGDVAVISATITTAAAANSSDNCVVTPTTSTSSVAITLDITANDNNENDEATIDSASSLESSSANNSSGSTVTSTSSKGIPTSDNMSSSSSSPSSSSSNPSTAPVDVPSTAATGLAGIGNKSLETFGKVAAGLLASATSTINNNNNNTSLAPTSCEAISIATTNANA